MEADVEGQPDDISSSNRSFVEQESNENVSLKDEKKVKECSENNEEDIDVEPEGNNDLTESNPSSASSLGTKENLAKTENEKVENPKSETYNGVKKTVAGDVRKVGEEYDEPNSTNELVDENNPSSGSTLGTRENLAKAENEKSGNEKVEDPNSGTYIAVKENVPGDNVPGDIRKVCEDYDEPNSRNELVGESQKDDLDKSSVTDDSKSSEIDSSIVNMEPKSPEIGFRKKSIGQFSPISSPVTSPQMTDKKGIRSPELGGRRRLKVHVFDTELGTASDITCKQEKSSERKDSESVVEEGSEQAPTISGKDEETKVREKASLLLPDTETTSLCLPAQEELPVCKGSEDSSSSAKETIDNIEKQSSSSEDICKKNEIVSEKGEVSIASLDHTSSAVDKDKSESSLSEEVENSISSLGETHSATRVTKPEDKIENSHDKKDVESNTFLNDSESSSVQCSADISNENSDDNHMQEEDRKVTTKGNSSVEESSCSQKELLDSKECSSVEKGNTSSLEIKEKTVKENYELPETQHTEVDNGNTTDLGITEKKILLSNECQNKSDPSNRTECHEDFNESKNPVKVARPLDGDVVDRKTKVSVCEEDCDVKEVNKSGDAPAESECVDKEVDKLNEIEKLSDENNCCKELGKTKFVDSNHSVNQCSQEGDKKLMDCSQSGENKKACEVNDSKELLDCNEKEPSMNEGEVNNPKDDLSLSERKSLLNQETDEVEMEDRDERIDTAPGKEEEEATGNERIQGDDKKVGIDESDQGSDDNSKGRLINRSDNCAEMRTCGGEGSPACVDTDKENLLTKSDTLESPETVQSSLPGTSGDETSQVTGGTHEDTLESPETLQSSLPGTGGDKTSQVTGGTHEDTLESPDTVQSSLPGTSGDETSQVTGGTHEDTLEPPDTVQSSLPGTSGDKTSQVTGGTHEDTLEPPDTVQSSLPGTSGDETSQVTGGTHEEEVSGNTQLTQNKKRLRDTDPGTCQSVSKPKHSRVSLDIKKHSDHHIKSDVETSSSGTFPMDTRVECVVISKKEGRRLNRQRVNVVDMVCKKCRSIWNDEVLRIIFKGTESVTVKSKITYGAIVCINNWINRNISGDKEEAITQVFERTDLGSNIAQLNISRLDEWLEELLQKGRNRCCKVFTAVYQPGKNMKLHKTKAKANMLKAAQTTQSNYDAKNQNSVVSKGKRSLDTKGKGPLNAKSQSPTGKKSQRPVANRGRPPVVARCQGLPKGRVFLVPAPAVASVLPSALASKSVPHEESTVLPKSASSLMKPCKIILKNPVRLGSKESNQSLSNASDARRVPAPSKLFPSGSSVGLTSEENTEVVSSKFASSNNSSKKSSPVSSSSMYQSSLKGRNSKSTKAAVFDNTVDSRDYHEHKVVSGKRSDKRGIIRKGEHEGVKSPAIGVESGISSRDPAIREMLKALNLDIEDVNIYSSYCSKPVTNKMKFECPSDDDKTSPCYLSMLKEREALNGNALIAFDLLLYESNNHYSIAPYGSTKRRFVTKRELLTLQSIFILNPETPDISRFYEVFVQILLSRKKVLLIPDSHTFLVVTEDIRREYNREKSKDLSIQILNENWDPFSICSADDVWLEGKNPEEVTNRDVISIFCTWRNLEENPSNQSLSKALHAIWQFHNVRNGDYFGICFRLYTKFIRIVYEEKDFELAKVFLDEPFSGGFSFASKKYLQNLVNSNKRKLSLPNCDDEEFKSVVERCEELEKMAQETLTAPVLRDLCAQVIIGQGKIKDFMESYEGIGDRLTDLLGKREKLLREIKGSEAKKLVQSMRAKISELHKAAQKRRQEHFSSERSIKRRKRDSDMNGSDIDPSCKEVSPHIKELIKDLFSKGVKPEKVRHVIGIVSGIIKEENMLKMPSEKWILNFAQMNS